MEIFVKEYLLLSIKIVDSKIPSLNKIEKDDKKLNDQIVESISDLRNLIDNQELNQYLKKVINISFNANKYFNDQKPWSLKDKDPDRMNTILYNSESNSIYKCVIKSNNSHCY